MFGAWTKLKESIFKNNNQINSNVTTRIWVLPTEWSRSLPSTRLVLKWKTRGGPRFLQWLILFLWMRVCCILSTKMKMMSLSASLSLSKRRYYFNFLKTFKRKHIILKPGIQIVLSYVCYDGTKHCQVPSER